MTRWVLVFFAVCACRGDATETEVTLNSIDENVFQLELAPGDGDVLGVFWTGRDPIIDTEALRYVAVDGKNGRPLAPARTVRDYGGGQELRGLTAVARDGLWTVVVHDDDELGVLASTIDGGLSDGPVTLISSVSEDRARVSAVATDNGEVFVAAILLNRDPGATTIAADLGSPAELDLDPAGDWGEVDDACAVFVSATGQRHVFFVESRIIGATLDAELGVVSDLAEIVADGDLGDLLDCGSSAEGLVGLLAVADNTEGLTLLVTDGTQLQGTFALPDTDGRFVESEASFAFVGEERVAVAYTRDDLGLPRVIFGVFDLSSGTWTTEVELTDGLDRARLPKLALLGSRAVVAYVLETSGGHRVKSRVVAL